jgi:tetratricopeptide (TPR) repeat protein
MKSYRGIFMVLASFGFIAARAEAQSALDAGKQAYDKGDYSKAISILEDAAEKEPGNGNIELWLTRSYLEAKQYDEAVKSGEKAVSIDAKSSVYHQWLGEVYGEKADHAGMMSAYGFARKTQKEFDTAVQLDEHNYDAAQDLVEYDCTAPGMVGGGVDKAQPLIQKLMSMDAAEGNYAAGNCKAAKKDYAAADPEFAKALENKPKSPGRLFDIGDYFVQREQADKVSAVAAQGETLAPKDPREKFYRAVGWILKGESHPEAEKLLREYLQEAPERSTNPSPAHAHYWLGRFYESQNDTDKAKSEYREALKLNPKFKKAQDALKQIGG